MKIYGSIIARLKQQFWITLDVEAWKYYRDKCPRLQNVSDVLIISIE
jgi:hypothetical protein